MSDSLAENPPTSDGTAAKPIVRRRRVETMQWSPELLLQVPDFRASNVVLPEETVTPDVSSEDSHLLATAASDHAAVEQQAVEQSASNHNQLVAHAQESSNEDTAYTIDFNEARTEFGIAPPKDRVGQAPAEQVTAEQTDQGTTTDTGLSYAPAQVTLSDQKARSIAQTGISVTTPEVSVFDPDRLSQKLKRNLGTIGTIAAAVAACIFVARAMKQDPTSPGPAPNQSMAAQPLVDVPQLPNQTFTAEVPSTTQPIQISTQGVQPQQLSAPQLVPPQNSPAAAPQPEATPKRQPAYRNRQATPLQPWQVARNPDGPTLQGRPQNFDTTPLQVEPAPTPGKINPFDRPAFRKRESVVPQPQRQFTAPELTLPEFKQSGIPGPNLGSPQNQPASQPQAVDPNSLNGIWPDTVNDAQQMLGELPAQINDQIKETQAQLQQQFQQPNPQFQQPVGEQQLGAPRFNGEPRFNTGPVAPSAQPASPTQQGLPALTPPANRAANTTPLNNRFTMPNDVQLPDLPEIPAMPTQVGSRLGGYPSTRGKTISELRADLEEQSIARSRQELRVGQSSESITNQPQERSFGPGSQFNSNGGVYRR